MLIRRIARREARNRRAREARVIVPALKVITGTRCRRQGDIRIQNRVACHRVRIGRRVTRRRDIVQRIRHAVIVRTAPLCIVGLGCRIHGREARNRRTGEGRIVIPALEGIAVPERREQIYIAAAVCEHRVTREVRSRVGRRVPRRASVVQNIIDRIGIRRAVPLCIVSLVLRIHGAKRRDRRSRKAGIIIPAAESITCPRRRIDCDIRIQHRIACDGIRIVCRVSRGGVVVQIPLHRITLSRTPLCIIVLILRIARREAGNRCARKAGVIVPAFKVIAGSRCRRQRDIRIQNRVACHCVRVGRRMSRGGSVIQRVCNRIGIGTAPLCIKGLGHGIHGREVGNRSAHKTCIVIPAEEGIAVSARRLQRNVAAAVREHRIACEIGARVGRRVTRRCSVIQDIVDWIRIRRRIPLCVVCLILRIHGVKRRNRCSRKADIIVPTEEGIARARRRLNRNIRILHGIACQRVRIACGMTCRRSVVQMPLHRVTLCSTPLRVVLLVLGIHGMQIRDRRSRETRIIVPALKVVAGACSRADGNIRIQHRVACHRIRVRRRMSRRGAVIQVPLHRIALRRTPLCIIVLIRRIAHRETGNRGPRKCRVVVPALKVIAGPRCRRQGDIRIQNRVAGHGVRVGRRMPRRRDIVQRIGNAVIVRTAPLCVVGLSLRIHHRERADRGTAECRIVIPAEEAVAAPKGRQEMHGSAAVGQNSVTCEVCHRIACRVARRRSVVQHIIDRIRNRRAVPLRKILLILRIHGVQVRDRRSRESRIVIPAEEGIAGTRRRLNRDIRIQHGITCHRIRIACRVARGCTVI